MWKGYLKTLCKNRKWYIVLPIVFLYLLLTLVCQYYKNTYLAEELATHYIVQEFHLFLPLFAGWWIVMIHSELVNEEGNELLHLYLSPFCIRQCRFAAILAYLISALLYFWVVHDIWGLHWFLFLQLCVEVIFVCGMVHCVIVLTNNTGVAMLLTTLYCIYLNKIDTSRILEPISVFPEEQVMNQKNISLIVVMLAVSLAFEAIGFLGDKFGNHIT